MAFVPFTGNLLPIGSDTSNSYSYSDQSKKSVSTSNQSSYQYSPTTQFSDQRQLVLVLNSAGATTNTKKADATTPSNFPSISQPNTQSPDLSGLTSNSPGFGGGFSTFQIALFGALILGGLWVATRRGR